MSNLSKLTAAHEKILDNVDSLHRDTHQKCHSTKQAQEEGYEPPKDQTSLNQDVQCSRQGCESDLDKSDVTESEDKVTGPASKHWTRRKTQTDHGWRRPVGMETGIQVYNSLTREKEPLILPNGRIASW